MYTWPITKRVGDRRFMNIEHIHPLMQLATLQLLDNLSGCPEVTRVVVFGSSVTPSCNPWSDLDVYIEGATRDVTKFKHETDAEALDIWFGSDRQEMPNEQLFVEIDETGVIVYSRD